MKGKWTYKKQLLLYFAGVFTFFATIIVLFQLSSARRYKEEILQSRLSAYADIIAQTEDRNAVMPLLPAELRVTVMLKDGTVIFDSRADVDSLDNHLMRPEVQKSIGGTEGFSIRVSDTTGISYLYFAKSYGSFVVRVALPYETDVRRFFQPDALFLILVFSLFVVALFSIIFLADHFGEGISRLHGLAEAAEKGAVDYDKISFPDSELGAIGDKMLESYRRLEQSNRMIALEKERLLLHIHYHDGGIAIFSPDREKLYANYKFIQFVNTLLDRPTPDINDIWKSPVFAPLYEFLDHSIPVKTDYPPVFRFKHAKGARNYDIQMLIYPDNGFEITISDVTEAEKNRNMKQQMTNNIAHELRTPVSSIRGYLETLVKEKVSLKAVSDEIFEEFREVLGTHRIRVENRLTDDLVIRGNTTLIYSIFRNLVENSLKYAGEGILIHLECYAKIDGHYHFTYYDTGRGVSEEHLSRIFERFYRVSEGRTRDAGGSGLGLSIVRNAVAFHGGDIRAVNRSEGGLEFIFSLKIS